MPKKSHKPAIIITVLILVVAIIGGFYYTIFSSKKSSSSKPDTDLTQVIQNQNAKKFLDMFDSDTTKSSISKIGAKSILLDWNQNSTEDISKISSILKRGGKVTGAENNFHIKYEETTRMLFIKQSKLTTMTSKLIVPVKLKKAAIKVDGKNISYSDLTTNNLFPGVYEFKIKLGKAESTQKVTILGDGRSATLIVPKKKENSITPKVEKSSNQEIDNNTKSTDANGNNNSSSSNNDPKYKDAAQLTSSDLVGTWTGVDGENDPLGAMPESIVFTGTTISVQCAHNIQNNMNIGSSRYSDNDGLMVFYGDDDTTMTNGFGVKLVKRQYNGQERVMLEQDDQGMTAWFIRQ